VKLYFDEDNGKGIPQSLKAVRAPADEIEYPRNSNHARQQLGTPDRIWLPWAGDNGYLVFSQNIHILENEDEFNLLVAHRVGIVFMKNGSERSWAVLRMILNRWEWLREIDAYEPRPFVFLVGLAGRPVRYELHQGPRRPRSRR
jgi:hypothetical protein